VCFFAKNYKIDSSNLKPRVHLGRQASKKKSKLHKMANLEWIVLDEIIANLDEGRDLKTLA
jgi:hypothetical protein